MSVTHIPQVAIETRHLYKRFGDVTALDDINLRIAQGEFVAIMGASGSGKTTLMNILTCLDTATEGQVFLDGTDAAALDEEGRRRFRAEKIGLVFQQFHLIPFLTALENIMLAQHYHSVVDEAAARKVLEQVGLGHRVTHLPSPSFPVVSSSVCVSPGRWSTNRRLFSRMNRRATWMKRMSSGCWICSPICIVRGARL